MEISLYTDGACRGNGKSQNAKGAIGIVIFDNMGIISEENPLLLQSLVNFKSNTNNKAEIYAVIIGLTSVAMNYATLEKQPMVKPKITIYCDSAYTINGITNWIISWRANNWKNSKKEEVKNKVLWETLDKMLRDMDKTYEIIFKKVEGHCGNKWNEMCDSLANEAMDKDIKRLPYFDSEKIKEGD